jgi:exodeoxyribonuclease-3
MGLIDTFRQFTHPPKTFTWWDYRMMGFRRNAGVRIDHILINQALQDSCAACEVDKTPRTWEQPSDHAPVILTLNKVQAP